MTSRDHITPTKMTERQKGKKKLDNTQYWRGYGKTRSLIQCWNEHTPTEALSKIVWQSLRPSDLLLGIFPTETYTHE